MKQKPPILLESRAAEVGRFVINGLFASMVHYAALTFNIQVLEFSSVGLANFFAAWAGIATSFIGSRFFVFRRREAPLVAQAMRFLAAYTSIACFHGILLYAWTDRFNQDYTLGLVLAAMMQAVLGYLGNKLLVFKAA